MDKKSLYGFGGILLAALAAVIAVSIDEVPLEYPYLNAQFLLSEDHILLWMDYAGEVYAKEVGTDHYLELEGITGNKGVFKSLSDDGQFLYMKEDVGMGKNRMSMLTSLDGEVELKKCVSVLQMLMQIYELLCSSLMLMMEDETVEDTLKLIKKLMKI